MVKGYPLGLLLFEWMVNEYDMKKKASHPRVINATASYEEWSQDRPLYLYEGFVTGSYKPTPSDFDTIKTNNTSLTNNEVIDAFITASALRAFVVKGLAMQSPLVLPNNLHPLTWIEHMRVCVDEDPNNKSHVFDVNSCLTDSVTGLCNYTPYIPSKAGLHKPERVTSVWEHFISDMNDLQNKTSIMLTDKKACDVYGFKFR